MPESEKKRTVTTIKNPLIFERNNGFQEAALDTNPGVLVVTDYFLGGRYMNSSQVLLNQV